MEMEAACAPATFTVPSFSIPAKVPDTMSAKAAITSKVKSQQNSRKSLRPVVPTYSSMSMPMDFPLFFTEA